MRPKMEPTDEEREKAIQSILKRSEYMRQYYQVNKEKRLEYQHQYNEEHKEEQAERRHNWYQDNRVRDDAYHRRRYWRHREEVLERAHQYYREHPEAAKRASAKRQASLRGVDGHFTIEEFILLCEAFENKCIYCGRGVPLGPDHMTPLSRGGSNYIDNIVPACKSCNSSKQAMTYEEYIERLEKEVRDEII